MFGDILSDEASELSGSLGLGGAINIGDGVCVAQAKHGSAPDIAGRQIANPTSLILSATMMLEWLGRQQDRPDLSAAARALESAVDATLDRTELRTRDIGGTAGTAEFAGAVAEALSGPVRPATVPDHELRVPGCPHAQPSPTS